jgi:hypothetical protein
MVILSTIFAILAGLIVWALVLTTSIEWRLQKQLRYVHQSPVLTIGPVHLVEREFVLLSGGPST